MSFFFETCHPNSSVDLRAASHRPLNLVSIPHVGFWGDLETEAKCCPGAKGGPCFSPLHRTGVEVSAAKKPRMAPKPPRLTQCRMHSHLAIGKRQSLAPAAPDEAVSCHLLLQSSCSGSRAAPGTRLGLIPGEECHLLNHLLGLAAPAAPGNAAPWRGPGHGSK